MDPHGIICSLSHTLPTSASYSLDMLAVDCNPAIAKDISHDLCDLNRFISLTVAACTVCFWGSPTAKPSHWAVGSTVATFGGADRTDHCTLCHYRLILCGISIPLIQCNGSHGKGLNDFCTVFRLRQVAAGKGVTTVIFINTENFSATLYLANLRFGIA